MAHRLAVQAKSRPGSGEGGLTLQAKFVTKAGATLDKVADLPESVRTNVTLGGQVVSDDTYLVKDNADLIKRGTIGQTAPVLTPHRHLIGEAHNASKFKSALETWGWGADKMAESYQTSPDVADQQTVANQAVPKRVGAVDNLYYQTKVLENLHPYMLQTLSLVRYALDKLQRNYGLMIGWADDIAKGTDTESNKRYFKNSESVLEGVGEYADSQWKEGIEQHIGSYVKSCTDRLKTARGEGNAGPQLLHDMATVMASKWKHLTAKNLAYLTKKPYSWSDSWAQTSVLLTAVRKNINNFVAEGVDPWADELVKMTKADAAIVAGNTTNDAAIGEGWQTAKGARDVTTALTSIGPMREIFMAHNINTNLTKPGLVQIGADHVTNLAGKITGGKLHNSYEDFVADTKK